MTTLRGHIREIRDGVAYLTLFDDDGSEFFATLNDEALRRSGCEAGGLISVAIEPVERSPIPEELAAEIEGLRRHYVATGEDAEGE